MLVFLVNPTAAFAQSKTLSIPRNQVIEWSYTSSKTYQNPFMEVELYASIKAPDGKTIQLPAFWAGENEWRFRFAAPETGNYIFTTTCNDAKNKGLHAQKGTILVQPYSEQNPLYLHGPLKLSADDRYLVHQDNTPFFWLADAW